MRSMRIRKRNSNRNTALTMQSLGIVMLSVCCFLVAGWVLIALVRLLAG